MDGNQSNKDWMNSGKRLHTIMSYSSFWELLLWPWDSLSWWVCTKIKIKLDWRLLYLFNMIFWFFSIFYKGMIHSFIIYCKYHTFSSLESSLMFMLNLYFKKSISSYWKWKVKRIIKHKIIRNWIKQVWKMQKKNSAAYRQ